MTNLELLDAIISLLRAYKDMDDKASHIAIQVSANLDLMLDELRLRARGLSNGGKS
jgi:hypothetical protein